jgi:hypothetical protein
MLTTQLIFFGSDSALLERLKSFSDELPYVNFEAGLGPDVVVKAQLDAFWATPMIGLELFGANPPFPIHEARVVKTPLVQRTQRGLPRYGIIGVSLADNDAKLPEYRLRLALSSLLEAVVQFNSENQEQIVRVGVLPEDFELKKLDPAVALKIIREVYERFVPASRRT